MVKLNNKYDNFNQAVKRLNEVNILYKKHSDDGVYQDALIKRFEFTFELAWKTLKEYMIEQGYKFKLASPKGVLSMAFQEGILDKEKVWLDMLEDRNVTSHDYGIEIAEGIAVKISNQYTKELTKLCKYIADNL